MSQSESVRVKLDQILSDVNKELPEDKKIDTATLQEYIGECYSGKGYSVDTVSERGYGYEIKDFIKWVKLKLNVGGRRKPTRRRKSRRRRSRKPVY